MPRLPFRATFKPIFDAETASLSHFRTHHFTPGIPFLFPREHFASSIPAIQKWFEPIQPWPLSAHALQINERYLLPRAKDVSVTVEVTSEDEGAKRFERAMLPFDVFLGYISAELKAERASKMRLYVAQQSLADLPKALKEDLPTPEVVKEAGKGDIYASSLWMGLPPTHTPLHRDPNLNLFVQMAGRKKVRMLRPEDGRRVFEAAKVTATEVDKREEDEAWDGEWLGRGGGKLGSMEGSMRGENMMVGLEGKLTEDMVWANTAHQGDEEMVGIETDLSPGDGLFIPLGWWHSIRGFGDGVNASANWWFR